MSDRTGPALVVTRHGGIDVLAVEDRPAPEPGAGEVLVEVAAAGVNFIDVYQREGVYPTTPPFVGGNEGAGTVVRVGEGSTGSGRVTGWPGPRRREAPRGTPSIPASALVPVPDGVDLETAAAVMLQGLTAHYLTTSTHAVRPGDVALVHAAAGGVGQLLVQMVAAARRVGRRDGRAAGEVRDRARPRRRARHRLPRGRRPRRRGAPADRRAGGRRRLRRRRQGHLRRVARPRCGRAGCSSLFGAASGQVPPFDIQRLNTGGSLFLTRPDARAPPRDPRRARVARR